MSLGGHTSWRSKETLPSFLDWSCWYRSNTSSLRGFLGLYRQYRRRFIRDGLIEAIGFSAHSEPMAIQMIETGLVDTVMLPINFASYHFGGIGKKVLEKAVEYKVGELATIID